MYVHAVLIHINTWVFASHTDYKPGIYLDAYLLIFPIIEIKKLLHTYIGDSTERWTPQ